MLIALAAGVGKVIHLVFYAKETNWQTIDSIPFFLLLGNI